MELNDKTWLGMFCLFITGMLLGNQIMHNTRINHLLENQFTCETLSVDSENCPELKISVKIDDKIDSQIDYSRLNGLFNPNHGTDICIKNSQNYENSSFQCYYVNNKLSDFDSDIGENDYSNYYLNNTLFMIIYVILIICELVYFMYVQD